MKKMLVGFMSAFLLMGTMFLMPLNSVSASTSVAVSSKSFQVKDNLGGTWQGEYKVEKKSSGACTLRLKVKHAYEKAVKKAQVKVEFGNGKTDSRNVSGMKRKNQWEQWTWSNNATYCSLKRLAIGNVEINK